MNKFILFSAIAVLVMPVSVTRASDMWTNPPKASCTFPYKYEGDALPTDNVYTNLGFYLVNPSNLGTNGVWLGTNGRDKYLVINSPSGAGDNYYTTSNFPAWQPATMGPFTVEIRARVVESTTYGLQLHMHDGWDNHNFTIFTDSVQIYSTTYTGQINTNIFHTFRIANFSYDNSNGGQSNVVWRDGVLLGQSHGQDAAFPPKQLIFGNDAGASDAFQVEVDYLRWTLGAYPYKADPPAGTKQTNADDDDGSGRVINHVSTAELDNNKPD